MKIYQSNAFMAAFAIALFSAVAIAQTTAFSYQGHLNNGAAPANGNYEMEFKLFDALAGGAQIGDTVTNASASVINGTFATTLDFGAPPFDTGAARYLEIAVRPAGNPNPFTVLTPRQQIKSAPFAIQARNAATADNATNALQLGGVDATEYVTTTSVGNAFIRNNTAPQSASNFNISGTGIIAGSLGIGTAAPNTRLTLNGGPQWTSNFWTASMNLQNASAIGWEANASGQRSGIGQSAGGLYFFRTNSAFGTTVNPSNYNMVITDTGNVGIGINTPGSKLEVIGSGNGVVGKSTDAGAGVFGESQNFNGLRGVGHNINHGAVVGIHAGGGIGVYGTSSGTGVFGESTSAAGNGGYFRNPAGFALIAEGKAYVTGHAAQNLGSNGLIKAMALIKDDNTVVLCYNSQAAGAAVSTPPCNITVTFENTGNYLIDFGFPVSNRYISLTPRTFTDGPTAPLDVTATVVGVSNLNQTRAYFRSSQGARSGFYIFIY